MKKIIPIVTLIIGVGIGWGVASYNSRFAFEKFQETWTPEFKEYITDAVRSGLILEEHMTEDEILEIASLGSKMVTDGNSQAFAQAKHALLMKKLIENEEVDDALSYSESCLERFVEQYNRGDFEDDINEEFAGKLADHIKSAIGIGLPIVEEPSLITVRTDRVYGDSAVTDGVSSKAD